MAAFRISAGDCFECIERLERVSISPCSLRELESQLKQLYDLLVTHQALIDSHLVNFFTENMWDTRLPTEWTEELERIRDDQLTVLSARRVREVVKSPSLIEFVEECDRMSLTSLGVPEFRRVLSLCTHEQPNLAMNEKKRHEVSQMIDLLGYLTKAVEISQVIDVGSGRGYLSEAIALKHRLKVIGLESKEGNTHSATKRNKIFERVMKNSVEQMHVASAASYVPVTVTVEARSESDAHSFLEQLAREYPGILDSRESTAIVGLHTCGQLACTIQEIFLTDPHVKLLFYVGCCYHLMSDDTGFPQSSFLKSKRATLSRTARNYCQTAKEQTGSKYVRSESLFYRAVLQWIIRHELGGHVDHLEGTTTI
ncbi:probable methyltransferase-like protein 25 [Corticium candelabrum]|uniref:probable methyltransferase-like protein 25 n=1 Tax=Corticium candelabrum TaxID=121492 RepID=UPI002E25A75C|nr:probable methyltransferase-like protein 25 [Corticium candelabrum]